MRYPHKRKVTTKQKPKPSFGKATKPKKGSLQFVLHNQDRYVTSKHSPGGFHEFNLAHYDLEIDGGWAKLKMKPATAKKLKL